MIKHTLIQVLMYMIAAIQLVFPNNLAAAEAAAASRMPEESFKVSLIEPDYSLAVTATKLISQTKGPEVVLVDIRSPEEFDRLRIPGSINVALHALKTKSFLKAQPFVLVNDGFQWRDLEDECHRLRQYGFQPSILFGGLVAWHNRGGALEGDQLALDEMRMVSPANLYIEKDSSHWLIVDASQSETDDSWRLFPLALRVPLKREILLAGFGESISNVIPPKKAGHRTVLIYTQTGEGYTSLQRMNRKSDANIFFLKGGLQSYARYINQLELFGQLPKSRTKRIGYCQSCEGSVRESYE